MRRALALVAALAILVVSAFPVGARVYYYTNPPPMTHVGYGDTNGVNCGVLSGSPFLCIKNANQAPVIDVQVVNLGSAFSPGGWILIPGGPIPPGGTTIVKFPTWGSGCAKMLFVKLASGATHSFALDVCHAASITISPF